MTFPFALISGSSNSGPPPIDHDWSAWNGSGNAPFSSLGGSYAPYSQFGGTVAAIPIDATRFLLVSNGYLNFDTSEYFPAQVMVGTLTSNQPTYGDPVDLDDDATSNAAANIFYRGVKISDGKIYLNYSWYWGGSGEQVNYAKIINIDISGNITFGARSVNIGTVSPSNSGVPLDLAKNNFGTPIQLYYQSATSLLYIVSSTINMDDTITINTAFNTGLTQTGSDRIECISSSLIFLVNGSTVLSYPLAAGVIGSSTASLALYPSDQAFNRSCALTQINSIQAAIIYDRSDEVSNNFICAKIVSYNAFGPNLTAGDEAVFFTCSIDNIALSLEVLNTGNVANQVIATYFSDTTDGYTTNAYAICLTPLGGGLSQSVPIQINANLADFLDLNIYPRSQSAIMNVNQIVSPYITYDKNGNYGLTIFNRENIFEIPTLLYRLKASDNIILTTPILVANGNGNLGSTSLTTSGDTTNAFVPGILFYEDTNQAQFHIVTSSSFSSGSTTVNFAPGLYNTLSDTPLNFTGIEIIGTSSGLYATFFRNLTPGDKACIGIINGQQTIIAWSTDSSVALTSDPIASEEAGLASSVLATNFTIFIVCHITSGTIFDTLTSANLLSTSSDNAALRLDSGLGTIFPTASGNVTLDYGGGTGFQLVVLAMTRNNGNSIAYVNNNEVYFANQEVLAMGSSMSNILFNNFQGDNPALGAISDVQLWAGSLDDASLRSIGEDLITEYSTL